MDYKELNKLLRDLDSLRNGKYVSKQVVKQLDGEGSQGDEGLSYEVYKVPSSEIYIKLEIRTDSYGDNERVAGIEFVKPVVKPVTTYEAV